MKGRLGTLVLLVGLLSVSVQPAAAIVYGDPDGGTRRPAHANVGSMLLDKGTGPSQICSGTLIRDASGSSPGVFLTAAHCTAAVQALGFGYGDLSITFAQDGQSGFIDVTGWKQHPKFNQRQSNPYDIAVLYLRQQTGLAAATVADADYLTTALDKRSLRAAEFTAVGYGVLRAEKTKGFQGIVWENEARYFATQHVQSLEKAWLTLAMNDRARENGGTCFGDSGGPHFHDAVGSDVLVSITVTGDAVCKAVDKTYRLDTPWVQTFLAEALADQD